VSILVNGTPRDFAEGRSVSDLLAELDLADRPVAVEVNCDLVPRSEHGSRRLAPGDKIEIVTLVGGG